MSLAALANLAYSLVATAPSPATTGTSLIVTAAQGARFPDPATNGAYNVVIWPVDALATPANAEIVRVTAKSTDTLTITREQEGTTARTVVVGDQIALAPTLDNLLTAGVPKIVRKTADETVDGTSIDGSVLQNDDHLLMALAANEVWAFKVWLIYDSGTTPDLKVAFTVPAGATLAWQATRRDAALATLITAETVSGNALPFGGGAVGTKLMGIIEGIVANGANAGNLQMQWAQNTDNASVTTVFANSCLLAWRLG